MAIEYFLYKNTKLNESDDEKKFKAEIKMLKRFMFVILLIATFAFFLLISEIMKIKDQNKLMEQVINKYQSVNLAN